MPRHARLDVPGTLHHVMARGIERTRIFIDNADREKFLFYLEHLVTQTGASIPAWSLMDNHFHMLVLSGAQGLASFMRKLMTRYAVYFNKKHQRTGHLFQNRYKSVLCEQDPYFLELVRYIHLNPLRAGIIKEIAELDRYPWCGHSVIMGETARIWQDRMYVLRNFSDDVSKAVRLYRAFVDEGKEMGNRPEFTGLSPRNKDKPAMRDERILGGDEFIIKILNETHQPYRRSMEKIDESALIARVCSESGINEEQLLNGSRRKAATEARSRIIQELVAKSGFTLTKVARLVGISPSGVANVLKKTEKDTGK